MTAARLEQQLSFVMEAEGLKQIFRQTVLPADRRAENDAEHSWHLSLMAILLSEHAVLISSTCCAYKMLLFTTL